MILIKLGGSVLQDDLLLKRLAKDLANIRKAGQQVVVVHGGGPAINEELRLRNISWSFVEGLRVTTPEMMKVIEMVLCGSVNQRITRALNAVDVPAVGLSGNDMTMLLCTPADARLGRVGEIKHVDTRLLQRVLTMENKEGWGVVPVIAPIGVGRDGEAFNVNADWAASQVACALGVHRLIFLTDQAGILDSSGLPMKELDSSRLRRLIDEGVVKDGMLAKVKTILHALDKKIPKVHVLSAKQERALVDLLLNGAQYGTLCV